MSLDSTVIKTITCFVKRRRKIRNRPTIIIDESLLSRSRYCQAPGPGLDKPGPQPGQPGHQLGQTYPKPT